MSSGQKGEFRCPNGFRSPRLLRPWAHQTAAQLTPRAHGELSAKAWFARPGTVQEAKQHHLTRVFQNDISLSKKLRALVG